MKKMPKQARAKARVQNILDVTQKLLLIHGINGITTTAISKEAGIPVGSVYQYFEDKEEILSTLYTQAFAEVSIMVEDTLNNLPSNTALEDTLKKLLQTFWTEAWHHPSYKPLTRWANAQQGLWAPTQDSAVVDLMRAIFNATGLTFPTERYETVLKLCTTVVSMIIDLAIEEETIEEAQKLIDELEIMLLKYITE